MQCGAVYNCAMNDFQTIINDLATQGWSVSHDFLAPSATLTLAHETQQLHAHGGMRQAGVSQARKISPDIRGDFIFWLEEPNLSAAQRDYLSALENLRQAVNAYLQLGIFEFEGHAALYPPGSFYRRHLDCFQNSNLRRLTCILYLNQDWNPQDGGHLRFYLDETHSLDIAPTGGTLVTFLSDRFWHEVLPANRDRMSITGWFKRRSYP